MKTSTCHLLLLAIATAILLPSAATADGPAYARCAWNDEFTDPIEDASGDAVGFRDGGNGIPTCYVVILPCDDHSRHSCAPDRVVEL